MLTNLINLSHITRYIFFFGFFCFQPTRLEHTIPWHNISTSTIVLFNCIMHKYYDWGSVRPTHQLVQAPTLSQRASKFTRALPCRSSCHCAIHSRNGQPKLRLPSFRGQWVTVWKNCGSLTQRAFKWYVWHYAEFTVICNVSGDNLSKLSCCRDRPLE